MPVLVSGEPEKVDEVRAKEILSQEDFGIRVELGAGTEKATYWTCDFSYVSFAYASCDIDCNELTIAFSRNM